MNIMWIYELRFFIIEKYCPSLKVPHSLLIIDFQTTCWKTEMWLISYKSPTAQTSNWNSVSCRYESDALFPSESQRNNHAQVGKFVKVSNNDVWFGTLDCYKLTVATYIFFYIWNTMDHFFQQLFAYILSNYNPGRAYPYPYWSRIESLNI